MSLPQQRSTRRQRNLSRALFVLVIILLVVGGLYLLAVNYGRPTDRGANASLPPPTFTPTAAIAAITPQRSGGLNEPLPPTLSPTATQAPAPTSTLVPSSTTTPTPAATSTPTATPLPPAEASLKTLDQAKVPLRDLYSIAARIKLKTTQPLARTTDRPAANYQVGRSDVFYMSDIIAKRYYTVTATVRQVTDHVYWYVQNGRPVDAPALKRAADLFENAIYPTDRRLFGSEWTPGVDNDPRITVLFGSISGAGGYYASADEYTRAINPFSNEREIIYINTSGGWGGIESTLAHEFQHMIHWNTQPGHDVWLNEGSSVLASDLNGYDVLGVDGDFMRGPDVQLNAWQANPDAARANYGAAFLFLDYLRAHYGGDAMIRAVVAANGQGTDAIDNALAAGGYSDRFTDVFKKWTLANLVDGVTGDKKAGLDYPDRAVSVSPQVVMDQYPRVYKGQLSQFGTDYVELSPQSGSRSLQVNFAGQPTTPVIAAPAHSGTGIWWSNRGDLADTSMTRAFDLGNLSTATLNFSLWFDVEEGFDYGYAEVSIDGGATWDTLKGKYTTATNPNGTNYGNGYTGKSSTKAAIEQSGWLDEKIDLTRYAGKQIMVRFEYITDDGYNAGGMAVDDISIPELGFADSAEANNGWQSAGFVRVANTLPQSYYLAVVKFKAGGFDVQPVEVAPSGKASFDITGLSAVGPYSKAVLVIAGTTPHIIGKATYNLDVEPGK